MPKTAADLRREAHEDYTTQTTIGCGQIEHRGYFCAAVVNRAGLVGKPGRTTYYIGAQRVSAAKLNEWLAQPGE